MNDRIFDFPWLRSQSVVQDPRHVCGGYMKEYVILLKVQLEVELGVEMCVCVCGGYVRKQV